MSRARLVWGVLGVIAALPYAVLKASWIVGGDAGLADPEAFADPVYLPANLLTLGMDLIAIGLFVALVHPAGRRAPASVMLPVLWAATGLLIPIVLISPVVVAGTTGPVAGDGLQPWVYTTVYGGFAVQGIALTVLTLLYVGDRWPDLFSSWPPTSPAVRTLAAIAAGVLIASALVQAGWAAGSDLGLGSSTAGQPELAFRWSSGAAALTSFAAAFGAAELFLTRSASTAKRRIWAAALVWVGTGASVLWGAYYLSTTFFLRSVDGNLADLVAVSRVVGGVVLAVVALLSLRRATLLERGLPPRSETAT